MNPANPPEWLKIMPPGSRKGPKPPEVDLALCDLWSAYFRCARGVEFRAPEGGRVVGGKNFAAGGAETFFPQNYLAKNFSEIRGPGSGLGPI